MAAAVVALSIVAAAAVAVVVSGSGGSGSGRAAAEAGARAPALVERLPLNAAAADGEEEGQGGWLVVDCWGAVDELRARCADEAAVFFLDGEAYLGRGCCLAVRAVGVTADEADVLSGFCGGTAHP